MSKVKPADDMIIRKGVTAPDGTTTWTESQKNPNAVVKKTPKEMKAAYLAKLGVYQKFLDENPGMKALVKAAISDYKNGKEWDDARFQAEYSRTEFALSRQKAQEEFDIGMGGPNADTYMKKVDDTATTIMQTAQRMGFTLSEKEAHQQATDMVRSALPQTSMDMFWANRYKSGTSETDASKIAGEPLTGTASEIQDKLTSLSNDYGIKLDEHSIRDKTAQALGQGDRWQEWMMGQENLFRTQAQGWYPGAAEALKTHTLKEIADPYLSDAADLLGETTQTMSLTDPKWSGFLAGDGARMLTRDEWQRTLKTDPKFGYDHSLNARKEASSLGASLLRVFGH